MVQARLPEVWYGSAPAAASEVRGYDFAELGTHNEVCIAALMAICTPCFSLAMAPSAGTI